MLICVFKIEYLEQNEGKYMITEFSFLEEHFL